MGAIGGILIFTLVLAGGVSVSVGAAVAYKRATAPIRRENQHLRNSAWNDRVEFESRRAFHNGYVRGYRKGRDNPLSDVERLAATLEERNIDFRTVPSKKRGDV